MAYYSLEEILSKMQSYCAYQERSHFQVEQKLRDFDLVPEAKDYILMKLMEDNFLNEERFARTYVRSKFYHNKWGKRKIINGLKQHRIHPNLIEKSLEEISPDEYIRLIQSLIEKKKNEFSTKNNFQKKQKIINYMLQKGFDYEDIKPYTKL